jgi:class 3 adenylate cyclase
VPGRSAPRTLAFLFADIRDYTSFVETHGDAIAHRLIADFRRMVRAQLALTGGGEIKTEGDSFYLVFDAASQAVRCGTAILHEAEQRSTSDRPLRVGVGIHAGEPVPLDDQYVGSAVNLAARIGAAAQAGEMLITDTVRGLLRTSGLPPLTERQGLILKGIEDAPRVYAVDWRRLEFMAAGEDLRRPPLLPSGKPRILLAGAGALVLAVVLAAGLLAWARPLTPLSPEATANLPSHGALLFDADLTPAGASREFVSVGDPKDHVLFTGDAIRFEVSPGSWAAISVANLSPDDFVSEFVIRPVSGDGSIALFFRGSAGRQDQVVVIPSTGELTIQVTQSFELDAPPQRLFGPASRIPSSRSQQTDLVVSARGHEIVVLLSGAEIARSTDSLNASGAIGVVANGAKNKSLVIELRALRVYNQ